MSRSQQLGKDFAASIVVFLVAMPLSMGIALASGAPLVAGLIAAAVGGIVAGLLGGTPLAVSGPAAGLAVMVFDMGERLGFAGVALCTALAGVLQILLGSAKVARLATAIAPAVLHGMLAGIGILIATAQVHVILGGTPKSSFTANVAALPEAVLGALRDGGWATPAVGLLTMAVIVLWPKLPRRGWSIPPALVAVLGATLAARWLQLDIPRVHLPQSLTFALPTLPDAWGPIVGATLAMALIASAESLLSALAVDKMHSGARANLNRELIGQGAANLLSGLLGGLPITGVIVRSTANIEAGARTRLSAILHGVWVIIAVTFCGVWLNQVPLTALAALLVVVGVRLVKVQEIRTLHRHNESFIYAVTLFGVVGLNLLAGIGMGLAASVLRLAWQLSRAQIEHTHQADDHQLRVRGAATFMLVPELTAALGRIPSGARVRILLDEAKPVDHAAHEALHSWSAGHEATGGQVCVEH